MLLKRGSRQPIALGNPGHLFERASACNPLQGNACAAVQGNLHASSPLMRSPPLRGTHRDVTSVTNLNTAYSIMRVFACAFSMLFVPEFVSGLRRVVVTGGNKGIGLQICKKMVQTEPDVYVILGSRDITRGESAVKEVIASEPTAEGRIELLEVDVTSDASIAAAAVRLKDKFPDGLYGLCNNAGVGFGKSIPDTLATNFYGTKRCCEAFLPLLDRAEGRICNVASASGPNFVRGLDEAGKTLFTSRETTWEQLEAELNNYSALTDFEGVAYGLSKAAVNQWTMQFAAANPNLKVRFASNNRPAFAFQVATDLPFDCFCDQINSCSPGYILTDLTRGMGATKRPEESNCHVAPLYLLFGDLPQPDKRGRYYGSDGVRSPIDVYRGPGDPPYIGD